jgi:hypothetical protein
MAWIYSEVLDVMELFVDLMANVVARTKGVIDVAVGISSSLSFTACYLYQASRTTEADQRAQKWYNATPLTLVAIQEPMLACSPTANALTVIVDIRTVI